MNVKQFQEKFSPWFEIVTKKFQCSFSEDYDINILSFLHGNIDREIKLVFSSTDRCWTNVRTQSLYNVLTYLYEHILWKLRKEDFPNASLSCVKLLSQLIRTGLLLTQGLTECEYMDRILTAIKLFTGKPTLLFDALLLVNGLKKLHHRPYSVILRCVLKTDYKDIKDPLLYMEILLLLRRLRALSDSSDETLYLLAKKMKPPSNLISWLSSLNVNGSVSFLKLLKHKKIVHQLMKKNIPEPLLKTVRHMILRSYYFEESCSAHTEMRVSSNPSDLFMIDTSSVVMRENQPVKSSNKNLNKVNSKKQGEHRRKKPTKDFVSNKKVVLSDKRQKESTISKSDSNIFYINNYSNLVIENQQSDSLQESDASEIHSFTNSAARTSKTMPLNTEKCKKSSKKRRKSKHIYNEELNNNEVEIINVVDIESSDNVTDVPAKKFKKAGEIDRLSRRKEACQRILPKRDFSENESVECNSESDIGNVKHRKKIKYTDDKIVNEYSLKSFNISSESNSENVCIISNEVKKPNRNSSNKSVDQKDVTFISEVISPKETTEKLKNLACQDNSAFVISNNESCDPQTLLLENPIPSIQTSLSQKISDSNDTSKKSCDENSDELRELTENKESSFRLSIKDVFQNPSNPNINSSIDEYTSITPEIEQSTVGSTMQPNKVSSHSISPSSDTDSCNIQKALGTHVEKAELNNGLSVKDVSKIKLVINDKFIDGCTKKDSNRDTLCLTIQHETQSASLETSGYDSALKEKEGEPSTGNNSKCWLSQEISDSNLNVAFQSDELYNKFDYVSPSVDENNSKQANQKNSNEEIDTPNILSSDPNVIPFSSKDNSVCNNFSQQSVNSSLITKNKKLITEEANVSSSSPLFLDASNDRYIEDNSALNIPSNKEVTQDVDEEQIVSLNDNDFEKSISQTVDPTMNSSTLSEHSKNMDLGNSSSKSTDEAMLEISTKCKVSEKSMKKSIENLSVKESESEIKYSNNSNFHTETITCPESTTNTEKVVSVVISSISSKIDEKVSEKSLPEVYCLPKENTMQLLLAAPQNEIMGKDLPKLTDTVPENDVNSEKIVSISQNDTNSECLLQNDTKSENLQKDFLTGRSFESDLNTDVSQYGKKSPNTMQGDLIGNSSQKEALQEDANFKNAFQAGEVVKSSSQFDLKMDNMLNNDNQSDDILSNGEIESTYQNETYSLSQDDEKSEDSLQKETVVENYLQKDIKTAYMPQEDIKSENIFQDCAKVQIASQDDMFLSQDDTKNKSILDDVLVAKSSSQNDPKTDNVSQDDKKSDNVIQGDSVGSTLQNEVFILPQDGTKSENIFQKEKSVKIMSHIDSEIDCESQVDNITENILKDVAEVKRTCQNEACNSSQNKETSKTNLQVNVVTESSPNDPKTISLSQKDKSSVNQSCGNPEIESTYQNEVFNPLQNEVRSEYVLPREVAPENSSLSDPKAVNVSQIDKKSENIVQCDADLQIVPQNNILSQDDTKSENLLPESLISESSSQNNLYADNIRQDNEKFENVLQDSVKAVDTFQNEVHCLSQKQAKLENFINEKAVVENSLQNVSSTDNGPQEEKSENIFQSDMEPEISSQNNAKAYSQSENKSQIDTKVDSLSEDNPQSINKLQVIKEASSGCPSNTVQCDIPNSIDKTVMKDNVNKCSYPVSITSKSNINISCDISKTGDSLACIKDSVFTSETDSEEIDVVNIGNGSESDAGITETNCSSYVDRIKELPFVAENKNNYKSVKENQLSEENIGKSSLKSMPNVLSEYTPHFCKNKDYVSFSDISLQNKNKNIVLDSGLKSPNPISNFSLAATAEIFCEYRNDLLLEDKTDVLSRDDVSSNMQDDFIKSPSLTSGGSDEELDSPTHSSAEEENLTNETVKTCDNKSNKIATKASDSSSSLNNDSYPVSDYETGDKCNIPNENENQQASTSDEKESDEKVLVRQSLRLRNKAEAKSKVCLDENPDAGESSDKESKSAEDCDSASQKLSSPKSDFIPCDDISSSTRSNKNISNILSTSEDKTSSQKSVSKKSICVSKRKSRSKDYVSPPKGYSLRHRKSRQLIDDSSNLGIDLTKLKLGSPCSKSTRSKSSIKDIKFAKLLTAEVNSQKSDSNDLTLSTKRETRSSSAKTEQDTPGYNLRTRSSIIAPGKLNI